MIRQKFDYKLEGAGAGSADNLLKMMADQQVSIKEKNKLSTFATQDHHQEDKMMDADDEEKKDDF